MSTCRYQVAFGESCGLALVDGVCTEHPRPGMTAERLTEIREDTLNHPHWLAGHCRGLLVEVDRLTAERDAARAELEALRRAVTAIADHLDTDETNPSPQRWRYLVPPGADRALVADLRAAVERPAEEAGG